MLPARVELYRKSRPAFAIPNTNPASRNTDMWVVHYLVWSSSYWISAAFPSVAHEAPEIFISWRFKFTWSSPIMRYKFTWSSLTMSLNVSSSSEVSLKSKSKMRRICSEVAGGLGLHIPNRAKSLKLENCQVRTWCVLTSRNGKVKFYARYCWVYVQPRMQFETVQTIFGDFHFYTVFVVFSNILSHIVMFLKKIRIIIRIWRRKYKYNVSRYQKDERTRSVFSLKWYSSQNECSGFDLSNVNWIRDRKKHTILSFYK